MGTDGVLLFFQSVKARSAAADMSRVGLSITEAYREHWLKPLDIAAGSLVVTFFQWKYEHLLTIIIECNSI